MGKMSDERVAAVWAKILPRPWNGMRPEEHQAQARIDALLARRALESGDAVKNADRCAICKHPVATHLANYAATLPPLPAEEHYCRVGNVGDGRPEGPCTCPGFRLMKP